MIASIDVARHGQSHDAREHNSEDESITDLALDTETIHVDGSNG